MPCVVRDLAFTMKEIFTRTFTGGVEISGERSEIIIKNRWRYLYKPAIDTHSSYKEKCYPVRTKKYNSSWESVRHFKVFSHSSVLWRSEILSIISPQTLSYIISETCDTLYKSVKILTLSLLKIIWYGHF